MPLLDHFHPPLSPRRHWESFHVNWAGAIADALNESLLPEGYFAEEHAQLGPWVEIDVATFTDSESSGQPVGRRLCRPAPGLPPPPRWLSRRRFPTPSKSWYSKTREEIAWWRRSSSSVRAIRTVPGTDRLRGQIASYLCRGISLEVSEFSGHGIARWSHRSVGQCSDHRCAAFRVWTQKGLPQAISPSSWRTRT